MQSLRSLKSFSLTKPHPQSSSYQPWRPNRLEWSAADRVPLVEHVLDRNECVDASMELALGKQIDHRKTVKHKSVLIVIKLMSGCSELKRGCHVTRIRVDGLQCELVPRYLGDP